MGNCCSAEPEMNHDSKPVTRDRPDTTKVQTGLPTNYGKDRGPKAVEHKYPNGSVYKGPMIANKREGNGVITWANGSKYVGMFKNDMMNGYGVFTW